MSRIISFSTADKAQVIGFLGAAEKFTAEQRRIAAFMQERAQARQADVERQDLGWELTVPEALDHLLSGHATCTAEAAGNAYAVAMQIVIDCNASDPVDLAVYSKPATFFDALDTELRHAGAPVGLLPGDRVMGGLPAEFPFPLPLPEHAMENFGHWPLDRVKPAIDAYRAVLDKVDESFASDLQLLIERLEFEHEEWEEHHDRDWFTQDTIFFSITG
ncbi:DUF7691 family protein [Streptomyces sp. BH055]|uniref:DUF7691 family protein n=1 Tax=Streptomyces sp. BH055 TaxID=3401173 RepID=UPI003BB58B48